MQDEPGDPAFEETMSRYLKRCSEGDREAMEQMLVQDLPLIHQEVRRRISRHILKGESASDVVQEVIIRILERGPVLRTPTRSDWRTLIVRIVRNTIIDRYRYYSAKQRDLAEQQSLERLSELTLQIADRDQPSPAEAAESNEVRGLVALGLHLLPDLQRQTVELRDRTDLDWQEIGAALQDIDGEQRSAAAARMLYRRAIKNLGRILVGLERGQISALLSEALASEGGAE